MQLEYNGQEQVPLGKDAVWEFINDPQKVASCLPDVQKVIVHDRQKFRCNCQCRSWTSARKVQIQDHPRATRGRQPHECQNIGWWFWQRGGFAGRCRSERQRRQHDHDSDWSGSATMRGPIATVGGRVLDAQAQKLISGTFANVKTRMAGA